MFTRKHYIEIAKIIKSAKEDVRGGTTAEYVLDCLEDNFSDFFREDNSNFIQARFINACKMD